MQARVSLPPPPLIIRYWCLFSGTEAAGRELLLVIITMDKQRLLIAGVHPDTEAYPNIYHRVRALRQCDAFSTETIHCQGWNSATQPRSGRARLWRNFTSMLWAHASVLLRSLFRGRPDITYIPYPAIGLLWLLSWFGKGWARERIVADAFISLYDTVVLDRELYAPNGVLARLLYMIERRAFAFADLVVVDTVENADHLAGLFSLPRERFFACPLSTDEINFQIQPYSVTATSTPSTAMGECRVLFIGTMIPLHGISTIVQAAKLLEDEPIQFCIVGDGQEGELLSNVGQNVAWLREWVDNERVAREIRDADLCLGIFGATDKADRVLPYKIYAYSVVGRAVITVASSCLRELTRELDYSPFYFVPAADPTALAEAIRELAASEELRRQYASASARFYQERLSSAALLNPLVQALRGGCAPGFLPQRRS